ncbi:MAG: ATP-binding protein [Phycisphaerae bacterium]|nr:ATP-binding protein [Phycisphaerae bacterium]
MAHHANRIWGILLVVAAGFGTAAIAFLLWQEQAVQGAWLNAALRIDAEAAERLADEVQKRRGELAGLAPEALDQALREFGLGGGYSLELLARDGRVLAAGESGRAHGTEIDPTTAALTANALLERVVQSHRGSTRFAATETTTVRALRPDGSDPFAAILLHRVRPVNTIAAAVGLSVLPQVVLFSLLPLAVLALFLYRTWTHPLGRVLQAARVAAEGRSTAAIAQPERGELGVLAHAVSRVQRRLQHQIENLQLERDSIAALLNRMHEGVIVADSRGRVALINPAAARLLNLPLDEGGGTATMIGKPVERCIPHHDVQRLLHAGRDESPRAGDYRVDAAPEDATFAVDLPDRTLEIVARAADLRLPSEDDASGRVRSRFIVLTDTTDLSEALQMKAEFVANASHELRTPLSTIRAAIETLQNMNWAEEPDDAARFLGLIDRHSARLSDLVSDLLDLSRIESPAVSHPARPIDLSNFLDELADRFADKLASRGVSLKATITGGSPELIASPYVLQLALDNLVDNAIKFSPSGSEVCISAAADEAGVTFDVVDRGCGIPEAEARRVFERFYQVERARGGGPTRGSGLGLAIVKHAATVLGGAVSLESTVGEGTTVTFRMPLLPPTISTGAESDSQRDSTSPERA